MSAKTFYIKGFDGLRAVSIIMVLCTHFGVYDNWSHTGWVNSLTHSITGSVGVTVFFVISGFLITTLLLNEKQRKGKINYKNFIIRRFLRLLPTLLLFYLVLLFLMYCGMLDIKPIAVLMSACYVYNYVPNPFYFSELGHTWSLAVEEQFYVFWPWVIVGFRKKGILLLAAVLILVSLIAIYVVPGIRIVYQNEPTLYWRSISCRPFLFSGHSAYHDWRRNGNIKFL
jgi:peptidoglycan/LPS O-acetylase OafA/YrhL